jgi:hypothetical protein
MESVSFLPRYKLLISPIHLLLVKRECVQNALSFCPVRKFVYQLHVLIDQTTNEEKTEHTGNCFITLPVFFFCLTAALLIASYCSMPISRHAMPISNVSTILLSSIFRLFYVAYFRNIFILTLHFSIPYRSNILLKNGVLWDVTPCVSCKNRSFGGTWRLLHQGDKNR